MSDKKLKTYQEVLEEIKKTENHLLLGNGFNVSLGVGTNYKSIFEEMESEYAGYQEIKDEFKKSGYDLEKLIGTLEKKIESTGGFLHKFVHNKIKLDFMKATSHIAASQVNKVYQEKNEGIYALLKQFTNYFTLNYDPFLYLLLMKFKGSKKNEAVVFQHTFQFIEDDLNEDQNGIYTKIKEARNNGQLIIHVNENDTSKDLSTCTKSEFSTVVKSHFKSENWKSKNIEKAISLVWKEENQKQELDINDGFFKDEDFGQPVFSEKPALAQNLFFLHGAFHIYQDKETTYKITQKSDKALYNRLEGIINNEEEDIVCVFSNDNKVNEIDGNEYLKQAYEKLSGLSGSMVFIGVSLAENDKHIFNQINKSKVDKIYLSSKEKSKDKDYKRAKMFFSKKQIILFDRETISYELPDNTND